MRNRLQQRLKREPAEAPSSAQSPSPVVAASAVKGSASGEVLAGAGDRTHRDDTPSEEFLTGDMEEDQSRLIDEIFQDLSMVEAAISSRKTSLENAVTISWAGN